MKKSNLLVIALLAILFGVAVTTYWPSSASGSTTIQISGTPGTAFTGFYEQGGKRVQVSETVPWALSGNDLSKFEFHKITPVSTFSYRIDHTGMGHSILSGNVPIGVEGLKGHISYRTAGTCVYSSFVKAPGMRIIGNERTLSPVLQISRLFCFFLLFNACSQPSPKPIQIHARSVVAKDGMPVCKVHAISILNQNAFVPATDTCMIPPKKLANVN